jgi:RNA polymerase sigma-70 factor (family 1)
MALTALDFSNSLHLVCKRFLFCVEPFTAYTLFNDCLGSVTHIKNGDEYVFQSVFEEYHEKLYYYILGKTKSSYIAEEVTQITFVKLWQTRQRLNEELSISIQLFRIARTTLIDHLRKEMTFSAAVNRMKEKIDPIPDNFNSPIDSKEVTAQLHHLINKLPPVRKKVFEMSRLEGMPYKDIASRLSISTKTVEKHISKAISQLKVFLNM